MLENAKKNGCCNDAVKHPSHYQSSSGLEVIDVIKAFTEDLSGYQAVYTGNVLKYMCRWHKKNGIEDLKKARQYLNWLIDTMEAEETNKKRTDPASINVTDYPDYSSKAWNSLSESEKDLARHIVRTTASIAIDLHDHDKPFPTYEELLNMTMKEENK